MPVFISTDEDNQLVVNNVAELGPTGPVDQMDPLDQPDRMDQTMYPEII